MTDDRSRMIMVHLALYGCTGFSMAKDMKDAKGRLKAQEKPLFPNGKAVCRAMSS